MEDFPSLSMTPKIAQSQVPMKQILAFLIWKAFSVFLTLLELKNQQKDEKQHEILHTKGNNEQAIQITPAY